jgi:hypothetical protein
MRRISTMRRTWSVRRLRRRWRCRRGLLPSRRLHATTAGGISPRRRATTPAASRVPAAAVSRARTARIRTATARRPTVARIRLRAIPDLGLLLRVVILVRRVIRRPRAAIRKLTPITAPGSTPLRKPERVKNWGGLENPPQFTRYAKGRSSQSGEGRTHPHAFPSSLNPMDSHDPV